MKFCTILILFVCGIFHYLNGGLQPSRMYHSATGLIFHLIAKDNPRELEKGLEHPDVDIHALQEVQGFDGDKIAYMPMAGYAAWIYGKNYLSIATILMKKRIDLGAQIQVLDEKRNPLFITNPFNILTSKQKKSGTAKN